jgi:hypothetical protein
VKVYLIWKVPEYAKPILRGCELDRRSAINQAKGGIPNRKHRLVMEVEVDDPADALRNAIEGSEGGGILSNVFMAFSGRDAP